MPHRAGDADKLAAVFVSDLDWLLYSIGSGTVGGLAGVLLMVLLYYGIPLLVGAAVWASMPFVWALTWAWGKYASRPGSLAYAGRQRRIKARIIDDNRLFQSIELIRYQGQAMRDQLRALEDGCWELRMDILTSRVRMSKLNAPGSS